MKIRTKDLTLTSLMISLWFSATVLSWVSPLGDPVGLSGLTIVVFIPLLPLSHILAALIYHNLKLIWGVIRTGPYIFSIWTLTSSLDPTTLNDRQFYGIVFLIWAYYGVISPCIWYIIFDRIGLYHRLENLRELKTF